nr:LuxR C-terminal-related transcriptional regulator [uncultured Draconibacterium sp.]
MLLTKLHIPQPKEHVVHRSALFEKLNEGLNRRLILVSATAGYGKTTLVSDWILQNKIPTAWYSVDSRDNDPFEFLSLMINSIQTVNENIGSKSLNLLKSPGTAEIKYIIELLINDILSVEKEFLLVIDDLHLINRSEIFKTLSFIIEYKPQNFKIALLTRSDPPISLARLRSQNELMEIRSSDLSFNERDITDFFNRKLKLGLTRQDISLVELKTEGWIAGLQLTALTLQNKDNISEYLKSIAGDSRYIMDYLIEEVLNTLDDDTREFLLKTSVLDQFSGSLCDAILDKNNGQQLLESLEKCNMFIVPLDDERKWFRYHHLFGDLLKQRLQIKHKEQLPELHKKAGLWYDSNGYSLFAIEHTLKAGSTEKALQLIDKEVDNLWETSQYSIILKFAQHLDENEVLSSGKFGIAYAWVLIIMGKLDVAEVFLDKLQSSIKNDDSNGARNKLMGRLYETYNLLKVFSGDVEAAFRYSKLAIENIETNDVLWNSWAHISYGESNLLRFELNKSISSFKIAREKAQKVDNLYLNLIATSKTAYVLKVKGEYTKSLELCNNLLETFNADSKIEEYRIGLLSSILYSIIGYILAEQGKTEEGIKNALKGYNLSRGVLSLSFQAYNALLLAETYYKAGEFNKALSLIEELEKIVNQDIAQWLYVLANSLKCNLLILLGEEEKALTILNQRKKTTKNHNFENYFYNVAIARYRISQKNYSESISLLTDLKKGLKSHDAFELLAEVELLMAKSLLLANKREEAINSVLDCLRCTQHDHFNRIYINEGAEIESLLREIAQRKKVSSSEKIDVVSDSYLNVLIEAFENEKKTNKAATENILSVRELDTLKLLAKEYSNQQIAEELFISLNTVKTHLKNINIKLEVDSRTKAVEKAKELGII